MTWTSTGRYCESVGAMRLMTAAVSWWAGGALRCEERKDSRGYIGGRWSKPS